MTTENATNTTAPVKSIDERIAEAQDVLSQICSVDLNSLLSSFDVESITKQIEVAKEKRRSIAMKLDDAGKLGRNKEAKEWGYTAAKAEVRKLEKMLEKNGTELIEKSLSKIEKLAKQLNEALQITGGVEEEAELEEV